MDENSEIRDFKDEIVFSASRSSGPGGQNVNKVNTKVEIRLNIEKSILLTEDEKLIVFNKLSNKINNQGELIVVSQSERTQLKNKENAIVKLNILIAKALKLKKKRKPTKMPKSVKEKRLKTKRLISEKKELRKNIDK